MGKSLTQKIIEKHLVVGKYLPGEEIGIRIDQTLTQDATGTMAYLQFEAMGLKQVKTELSVSYVDHNTIQVGFENADDHKYLQNHLLVRDGGDFPPNMVSFTPRQETEYATKFIWKGLVNLGRLFLVLIVTQRREVA